MKRAFITGQSGFSGKHLTARLETAGYAVTGFDRGSGGDIRDRAALVRAIRAAQPDVVFHLAAAIKAANPEDLYSVNVMGTVSLLEALHEVGREPLVVVVSSSAVYGRAHPGRPVREDSPLRPETHYGASKVGQEQIASFYARSRHMRMIRIRTFNLLGPGLPTALACGSFVDAIVRIERGGAGGTFQTGNLGASRDFTDVRDAVRAYVALSERGRPGSVYNVCSGTAVSMRRCVDVLLDLSTSSIVAEADRGTQEEEIEMQVGAPDRLHAATGWVPTIGIEQSLADMLESRRMDNAQ